MHQESQKDRSLSMKDGFLFNRVSLNYNVHGISKEREFDSCIFSKTGKIERSINKALHLTNHLVPVT